MLVVIPTHDRNGMLERTLNSLAECRLPESYHGTLVVENGGENGAELVVNRASERLRCGYQYFAAGNKSAALNYALEKIDDTLIVFFDDDVRVHPDTLMAYERAARGIARGVFFGGPLEIDYEEERPEWLVFPSSVRGWSLPPEAEVGPEQSFIGANWAAFSSDLKSAGGFDPAVGPGGTSGGRGQELTMQGKLRSAGCKPFYVSDALVWHYVPKERSTEKWSLQRAYQMGVTHGLEDVNDATQLLGVPRWAIKRYGVLLGKAMWGSLTKTRPKKYLAWREFHVLRGYLRGFRLRQQREGSHHPNTIPAREDISS